MALKLFKPLKTAEELLQEEANKQYKALIRRRVKRLRAGSIEDKYQAIMLLKKIGE